MCWVFICTLQTECIREYEHLRYIPIVLLAPSMPRLNRKHERYSLHLVAADVLQSNGVWTIASARK